MAKRRYPNMMERNDAWIIRAVPIAGASIACAIGMRAITGFPGHPKGKTGLTLALAVVALVALYRFLRHLFALWRANVSNPTQRLRVDFKPALMSFAPIVIGILIISAFLASISFLKSMIVAVVPFWADEPLADIDQMMLIDPQYFGVALQPILPAIGFFYGLWHVANLGGILWVLHWRDGKKSQLILAYMLTWVIGMFFAFVFSSAGPLFTGRYDIAIAPPSVRVPAELLWTNYTQKGALLGGGISAFPSLHVAIATWFGLVLRARGATWLGVGYALAIFASSIVLGWHYTADGVAGIAIALIAYRVGGLWLRQRDHALMVVAGATVAN